jgi:hypothetical protein
MLHSDPPQFKVLGPVWDADQEYVAPTPTEVPPTAVNPLTGEIEPAGPEVPNPAPVEPPADWEPEYRKGDPKPETLATQARLEEIMDRNNLPALLLQAAETGAALGGSTLKIDWDEAVDAEAPLISVQEPDAAVPEFKSGRLVAITYWTVIRRDAGGSVVRWLERVERGGVFHGVYRGTDEMLGKAVPLAEYDATRYLSGLVNEEGRITEGYDTLESYRTAFWIPNMLPDPMNRKGRAGRSDFTPAMLGLFDAIDEVVSNMMRDISNGKGRLVVPDYMLEDNGAGAGQTFDRDRSVYSPLAMEPAEDGGQSNQITIAQFQMRVAEHIQAVEHLIARVVMSAGYNMRTMGSASDGVAITATQTLAEDRRSLSTRDKKTRYWAPELAALAETLLAVDKARFSQADPMIQVFPVEVRYNEGVQPDMLNLAQTVQAMKNAEAASIRVRVETVHPDWDESRISAEVAAIQSESSVVDPNTFGLGGTDNFGAPINPGVDNAEGDEDEEFGA